MERPRGGESPLMLEGIIMKNNEFLYYAIKAIAETFTDKDGYFDYDKKGGIASNTILFSGANKGIILMVASFCRVIWNEIQKQEK